METYLLKNWYVANSVYLHSRCRRPLEAGLRIWGMVYGHPDFESGREVTTSKVVEVRGTVVVTENGLKRGHEYELQDPASEYVRMLREMGLCFDPFDPLNALEM